MGGGAVTTEFALGGVYVSPFFVTLLLALPVYLLCRGVLARTGVMARLWYPPLFEVGMFIIILFAVSALV